MDKIFNLYKMVLLAHIGTKTNDPLFHEKSAGFYELLFDVFHTISEKKQDIGLDESLDCEIARKTSYDALEKAKEIVGSMISKDNSIGMDNLLRGLYDKLETACGSAKSFIEEEEEDEEEEPKKYKPLINK